MRRAIITALLRLAGEGLDASLTSGNQMFHFGGGVSYFLGVVVGGFSVRLENLKKTWLGPNWPVGLSCTTDLYIFHTLQNQCSVEIERRSCGVLGPNVTTATDLLGGLKQRLYLCLSCVYTLWE